MSEQAQNEINAVKILQLAGEGYLAGLDELSRNFVTPQVRAAVSIFGAIVEERNPSVAAVPAVAEAANDAAPAAGKAE